MHDHQLRAENVDESLGAAPDISLSLNLDKVSIAVGNRTNSCAAFPISPLSGSASAASSASVAQQSSQTAAVQLIPAAKSSLESLASGLLDKKGGMLRGWKQYFCVVKSGEVSYYEKEADAEAGKPPRKFYLLQDAVVRHAPHPGRSHTLEVVLFPSTAKEKLLVFSATASTFEGWYDAFCKGVRGISSGGRVVARISEFVELPSLSQDDDFVSVSISPTRVDVTLSLQRR
jgi:hypothetical protein